MYMVVAAVALWFLSLVHDIEGTALNYTYHGQSDIKAFLQNVTSLYPNISHVYSIGKSVMGQELWVIAIGKNPTEHVSLRPHVKYVGNIHGNEPIGRELLLLLIEHFIKTYYTNTTISGFLNNTVIHILPSLNPDGFDIASEGDCSGILGRLNNAGIDLNRNFPDFFEDNQSNLQPETIAMMDWMEKYTFVLSANFHGGSLVANFPFDNYKKTIPIPISRYSKSPDDDVFRYLAMVYSMSHPTMHLAHTCVLRNESFVDGITNGAMWYPITGGLQDYSYVEHGCMDLTMEVSCCKYPMSQELPGFWSKNKDALINFVFQVNMGVRGLILHTNGSAIAGAELSIQCRDLVKFKSSKYGEYWRLLLPGQYKLQVKVGNHPMKLVEFEVKQGEVTHLNIVLDKSSSKQSNFIWIVTKPTTNCEQENGVNYSSTITCSFLLVIFLVVVVFKFTL